ncbi:hypothetical protein [Micromonospora sediminicola]|uniref:hypothetical protein n=1 Tax=Micromonospora sediminicola TaxID=946078 RepID=UPI000A529B28|nr:hypothetical protein [Micromonospora sediminicola]
MPPLGSSYRAGIDHLGGCRHHVDILSLGRKDLAPGDVEVHHPNIIHRSEADTSPRLRCGLTIRHIPTSTRITDPEQPYPSAFLLRGKPGVDTYQQPPSFRAGEHYAYRNA